MSNINNTSNYRPFSQYQSQQQSSEKLYFNDNLKQSIIKKARQNERYRLPLHVNYYKWEKTIDIRPYLHYFAGIGIEKLYLFYTHVLYLLDPQGLSNGTKLRRFYRDMSGNIHNLRNQIWEDMLMMVQDIVFVRKLRKLEKFTELDFQKINRRAKEDTISILKGEKEFGFDRKQLLYFLVDVAVNSLQEPTEDNNYQLYNIGKSQSLLSVIQDQIYKGKFSKEDRLYALKTLYTHKVYTPNISTNNDYCLYELNFEKLREHIRIAYNDKRYKKEVMDKLEPLITKEKETQTEEPVITKDKEIQTEEQVQTDVQII